MIAILRGAFCVWCGLLVIMSAFTASWYFGFDKGYCAGLMVEEMPEEPRRYEPKSLIAAAGIEGDWTEEAE